MIPEELGGVGGSAREVAVIAEELGRAVAPVPFLGSAVLATSALLAVGHERRAGGGTAGQAGLRRGDGDAAAVPLSAVPGAPMTVRVEDGGLAGTVTSVVDATAATVLLVPTEDGLFSVPVGDGVTVTPVTALDPHARHRGRRVRRCRG